MSLSKIKSEQDSDSDFEEIQPKHFRIMNDAEIKNLQDELDPANTVKSDQKCERIFVSYLQAIEMDEKYWEYSNEQLDNILGNFWFATAPQKKEKGEHYSLATLRHIRYALKRLLYKHGKKVDILTHPDFSESQKLFTDATRELKKKGYGATKHTKEIKASGKPSLCIPKFVNFGLLFS